MHEMEEVKAELEKIKEIKKCLVSGVELAVGQGIFAKEVEADELGKVVDMIKDLAETERNCMEACYYKSVVEAMKEAKEGENDGMGYNHNHYSNGRFAPSGSGHYVSGYMPDEELMGHMNYSMGYSGGGRGGSGSSGGSNSGRSSGSNSGNSSGNSGGSSGGSYGFYDDSMRMGNNFGRAYGEYMDARRHYHDSKSSGDKNQMDQKALEHVDGSVMTLKEIWKEADPSVQKEVKQAIKKLAEEIDKP